ncbi:MAG TPA: glycosyltransferase [Devosiaceae bacterium]|nr:glycosyltransferase [Devosiaceae bacterium]
MILLTIGTQLPFDRLVKAMDELAPTLSEEIFGQIGEASYQPQNFEWAATLKPHEFEARFRSASVVVSHAGIGTILTAQKLQKPLIIVPRQAKYGEHRNDHQLATAYQVRDKPGVHVAAEVSELAGLLQHGSLEAARDDLDVDGRLLFVSNLRTYLASG